MTQRNTLVKRDIMATKGDGGSLSESCPCRAAQTVTASEGKALKRPGDVIVLLLKRHVFVMGNTGCGITQCKYLVVLPQGPKTTTEDKLRNCPIYS
jgi:hypothetical protein